MAAESQQTPPDAPTETPTASDDAVECKHPDIKATAWLSPWWIKNTDWQPVTKK